MLSVPEELLLLAIDDTTGTIAPAGPGALAYGLAGAVLMDLLLAGRLGLADGKVVLTDAAPTGDAVLDEAALAIAQRQAGDTRHWIETLGRAHLEEQVIAQLVRRGILRKDEHRVAWIFPVTRYPTADSAPERAIRQRLRAAVLDGAAPEPRLVALLRLVRACNLTAQVFSEEERQRYARRIDQLAANDAIGHAIAHATEEAQAAIAAAMAATIAASIAGAVAASTAACSSSASAACHA